MIETRDALTNLDEILAIDGVDIVYVGPFDLSVSLGLQPQNNDGVEIFDHALRQILDGCRQNGVVPAIHADARIAPKRLEQGFRMVTCGIDFTVQYSGMARALKGAKEAQSGKAQ